MIDRIFSVILDANMQSPLAGTARGDWTCDAEEWLKNHSILGTPPELARNWRLRHHLLRTQTSGPTPKVLRAPNPPALFAPDR